MYHHAWLWKHAGQDEQGRCEPGLGDSEKDKKLTTAGDFGRFLPVSSFRFILHHNEPGRKKATFTSFHHHSAAAAAARCFALPWLSSLGSSLNEWLITWTMGFVTGGNVLTVGPVYVSYNSTRPSGLTAGVKRTA